MFLTLGTILGALVVLGVWRRMLHPWHTLLVFLAGVFLAGSAVGIFAKQAAQTTADTVQNVRIQHSGPVSTVPARPAVKAGP